MQMSLGFTPAIQSFVLASEGGYVDHPKDPGGATNMGITFAVLQAWRKRKITKADVKALTKAEALEIYKANYWDVMQCSRLPLGVDYMTMDYGVNSGPGRAIKDLQRVVGASDDGVIGAKTLALIDSFIKSKGIAVLLEAYANARWAFMKGLSTFSTFKNSWKTRVWGKQDGLQTTDMGVADRGLKLAFGVPAAMIAMPEATIGSAIPEKPGVIDMIKDPATLTAGGGLVATVLGAIQDQPILQAGAVIAVLGVLAFYLYQKRQANPT